MNKIIIEKDLIAEEIDTLAELCALWSKRREQGITPKGIRAAIIMTAEEIIKILKT